MLEKLFSPLSIGSITIKNRIQVTPHELQYFQNGLVSETLVYYYVERAKGGVGLLEVSQLTVKPPTGTPHPDWEYDSARRFPMVSAPEIVPGLKELSAAVHLYGAKIFMQISEWFYFGTVSGIPFESGLSLKEMTQSDIRSLQEAFRVASKYVKEGGFDGIDLHGTHGSQIEHFYSPASNVRTDRYGGNFENRLRFVSELIDIVRGEIGTSMALGMRLCADEKVDGGVTPEYASRMAKALDGKFDFLNIDNGSFSNFEALDQHALQAQPLYAAPGYGVYMSAAVKKAVKNTKVGIVGRITDPLLAEQILQKGQSDYIGMTRALIADPELPKKAFEGRFEEIRPCIGTLEGCWGRSVGKWDAVHEWPMRCTVNPSVGREKERGAGRLSQASLKKTVLIIGAGPAGLEAARVASMRGHRVVIYEKEGVLGGQLTIAKKLPKRADVGAIVGWYELQLKKNFVRLEIRKEVPADPNAVRYLIDVEKPDVVIIATGSNPIKTGIQMVTFREIPGWNRPNVVAVDEVLAEQRAVQGNVLVADSTTYVEGPCVSEWLAARGLNVTLVTPHPQLAPELGYFNQSVYYSKRLLELEVRVMTYSWVKSIEEHSALVYQIPTKTEQEIESDFVVLNTGRKQNNRLKQLITGLVKEVYEIGDCDLAGGRMRAAVEAGYRVGVSI